MPWTCEVRWVSRNANLVADNIAKLASSGIAGMSFGYTPSQVISFFK